MANLQTTYLGIPLKSPIIVGASSLSNMIDRVQRAESAGAGALVIRSLFEEQVKNEQVSLGRDTGPLDPDHLEEARTHFSNLDDDAARSHLLWVKKTRDAVKLPLFASLNASSLGTWTTYARELARTGIDGLEVNVYRVAADMNQSGAEIESELYKVVEAVRAEVQIPIAVKLSPYYTSVSNVAAELDKRGANGLVLFNRFLQPDIKLEDFSLFSETHFSTSDEIRLPLRWTAVLHGRIQAEIALSTGVHTGQDAAKALLSGAQVVQMTSALFEKGLDHITTVNNELSAWMDEHQFADLAAFRGLLSQKNVADPAAFERAQYVKLLVHER